MQMLYFAPVRDANKIELSFCHCSPVSPSLMTGRQNRK